MTEYDTLPAPLRFLLFMTLQTGINIGAFLVRLWLGAWDATNVLALGMGLLCWAWAWHRYTQARRRARRDAGLTELARLSQEMEYD